MSATYFKKPTASFSTSRSNDHNAGTIAACNSDEQDRTNHQNTNLCILRFPSAQCGIPQTTLLLSHRSQVLQEQPSSKPSQIYQSSSSFLPITSSGSSIYHMQSKIPEFRHQTNMIPSLVSRSTINIMLASECTYTHISWHH